MELNFDKFEKLSAAGPSVNDEANNVKILDFNESLVNIQNSLQALNIHQALVYN